MGCFILCWLPFFILALIKPVSIGSNLKAGDYIPIWLDSFLLWLGYFNSALNPMIYARFNREFRRPFIEILCFRCKNINNKLRDLERKKVQLDMNASNKAYWQNMSTDQLPSNLLSNSKLSSTTIHNPTLINESQKEIKFELVNVRFYTCFFFLFTINR